MVVKVNWDVGGSEAMAVKPLFGPMDAPAPLPEPS